MNPAALSDIWRRVNNLIRIGVVAQVDYPAARVRVRSADLETGWLPWVTDRAGGDRTWWAPEMGEQVLLLAPSGDLSGAVVLGSIYRNAFPAPGDRETLHRHVYADGASVEYDREIHRYTISLPNNGAEVRIMTSGHVTVAADGDVALTSGANVDIGAQGNVRIEGAGIALVGPVTASSTITAQTEVTANGINLTTHRHMEQGDGNLVGLPQ